MKSSSDINTEEYEPQEGLILAPPAKDLYHFVWDMSESPEAPRREVGIGIGEDLTPQEVLQKALQIKIPQIIQKNTFLPDAEKDSAILLYHKINTLFESPLSAILTPQNVSPEQEKKLTLLYKEITSSNEKRPCLDQLEAALSGLCRATLTPDVILVADEILSNAIYNAPFVDQTNGTPGASRLNGDVQFDRPAKFMVGHDGERLAVACLDSYGALNVEKLIKRINSCYDTGPAANMNRTVAGGAQIGSFLVFQSCLSYYVAVHPGKYTLVAATFPLQMNRKKREALTKNIHIFKV